MGGQGHPPLQSAGTHQKAARLQWEPGGFLICCLFAEGGGILRDHELLVGRDDPDLDLGVVGRDDGLFAAGLVLLRVELDAEALEPFADGGAHGR